MPLDPADLAALRRTVHGPQRAGLLVAAAGLMLAAIRWRWYPAMPRAVPAAIILLALGLTGMGIVRRLRWHLDLRRRP